MSIHFWDKNVKEIRYGQKKVKEVWYGDKKVWPSDTEYNLDLENDLPIGRLHDGELWFKVDTLWYPMILPVHWAWGTTYDWDISVDWKEPQRFQWVHGGPGISIPLKRWKHYVKITPHNWVHAWWARCLWYGDWSTTAKWGKRFTVYNLQFLPWYAFMESETEVWDFFCQYLFRYSPNITKAPYKMSLPEWITTVWNSFLKGIFSACWDLKEIPESFKIPNQIIHVWNEFLMKAFSFTSSVDIWFSADILPQNIETIWYSFLEDAWLSNHKAKFHEGFNLPQKITDFKRRFLMQTWAFCKELEKMPDSFNIPVNATSVDEYSFMYTWRECKALKWVPVGFQIPEGIAINWNNVFCWMFTNCTSLWKTPPTKQLRFPLNPKKYSGFWSQIFTRTQFPRTEWNIKPWNAYEISTT